VVPFRQLTNLTSFQPSEKSYAIPVNEAEYGDKQGSDLDADITNSSEYKKDRMPSGHFVRDMYTEKFDRNLKHNAAIGV
jgi:hypothetical protein